MPKLTSEQVKQLADNMLHMTNALGDYRYENFDKLTEDENKKIKEIHGQMLNYTTELYTKSALLTMEDIESSLAQIDTISAKTRQLYKSLTGVQNVIDQATGVLKIAAAILSLDTTQISASIKKMIG
ncbi:hypothetical protein [Pseudozobellia thermophila]|uniref:Uncharacterized protein n=1 Tax=Pseudozobellia thermophila TaxID=192903 RepID=A0A1M6HSJ5_9FLAO|nr:hypothetical protein [Pseudozobellia thermophila]SHJ25155.1 hypothetical protein SAMN04488513_103161 [Pseudozobellia thermophila]